MTETNKKPDDDSLLVITYQIDGKDFTVYRNVKAEKEYQEALRIWGEENEKKWYNKYKCKKTL